MALRLACGSLAGLRTLPADLSYDACLEESQTVMFDVAEKAMVAAKVTPREVQRPTQLEPARCARCDAVVLPPKRSTSPATAKM